MTAEVYRFQEIRVFVDTDTQEFIYVVGDDVGEAPTFKEAVKAAEGGEDD